MEIKIVKNVKAENEVHADEVRQERKPHKQSMFNFMSSPGSGKTTLLQKLIPLLKEKNLRPAVIEGDIATANDAEKLQSLNIPISLINTEKFGGECHLGAHVVLEAMNTLHEHEIDMFLIENVGNLVCPAEFDTGADVNITLLSVTEGEDKPLKYPLAFRVSSVAIISKSDIAQALEVDMDLMKKNIYQINPEMKVFTVSGKTQEGIAELRDYLLERHHYFTTQ